MTPGERLRHVPAPSRNRGDALYAATVILLAFITLAGFLKGDIGRGRWGLVAVALALLPLVAESVTRVTFPWQMKCSISLALALHMAGGIFGLYFSWYPVYDKVCHFVSSAALALLVFTAVLVLAGVTGLAPGRGTVLVLVVAAVIVLALAWEYAEFRFDLLAGSTYFHDLQDSVLDMLSNGAGIAAAVPFLDRMLKRGSPGELYRTLIRRPR